MSEGGKQYLQDQLIGWRRNDPWEASQRFFVVFGVAMLGYVAWDWVAREEIRYDRAFWLSLAFATAFAACSMIFKIRPVFRK
ncbi:hypothetical protein [Porphyrobacter sp. LM 6]|uniref:hypothetical protein n=1 Tax=Porphyrobacter sp. LM 6 TaxID=1896196 RepID=UPI000846FBD0|nr:hypothetical protein [Porphyrobacter sp. LM 6]AOL95118.1 hypothetical protein BG023_112203 [Porphyrobacter sp. LM 6]